MTQSQLFSALIVTVLMVITGLRELKGSRFALGSFLILIPVCFWASVFYGGPP